MQPLAQDSEKRQYLRLGRRIPVSLSLAEDSGQMSFFYQVLAHNISEDGMFLESEFLKDKSSYLFPKRHLYIEFNLPGSQRALKLESQIIWTKSTKETCAIGIKFYQISQEEKHIIALYINKESVLTERRSNEETTAQVLDISVPAKIESSVIVKRPKEEVYNFLKDMQRFPEFMENVKQVDILEGRSNRIITEWEVDFEGTTLTWKEEDIFDDRNMTIRFRMLEGDFGRYEGQWQLFSLLTGTEIRLRLIADWGLSVLNQYMQSNLKKMTREYAQSMLNVLKREMRVNEVTPLSKFACVIHPLNVDLVTIFDNNAKRKRESVLKNILEWMPPFWTSYITGIKSLTGKGIEGEFVMCPLLPDQILSLDSNVVLKKVIAAGKIAQERGARIFGLAAYTAGVGRKGLLVANALNIPVTTGTSYTIATAIEATLKAAEKIGIELSNAKVVIIGATGGIGSICAQILANRVKRFTLVARNKERLDNLANSIRESSVAIVKTANIIEKAIFQDADIIITSTNTPSTLINVDYLPPGVVVCDMSLPKNISEEAANLRKDILVIDGGIVRPPGDVNFNFYFGLPPGLCYACIAEPMILTLEEKYECYSIGGNVSLDKVREISQLASKHGFKLAELRSFGKEVEEEQLETVRRKV